MKATVRLMMITIISMALAGQALAQANNQSYGQTSFPNSGAEEAQSAFVTGILMLHSFEYDDARDAFQQAQEIDPEFALAYWGESLTWYKRLWYQIDLDQARAALSKFGATAQERSDRAKTAMDRAFLDSVAILFGEGDQRIRERQYAEALAKIAADYPEQENARALWSLAVMWTDEGDSRQLVRSAAIAEEVVARNPNHPGGLHYLTHAYDTPVLAPLGLRAALVYDGVAPDAAHALHMPSHIYVALGMWERSVIINIRSYAAAQAWSEQHGVGMHGSGAHASQWLQYSLLQQGRKQEAKNLFEDFKAELETSPDRLGQFVEAWETYMAETGYSDADLASLELETGAMNDGAKLAYHFTRAAIAAHAGDAAATSQALDNIKAIEPKTGGRSRWQEKKREVAILQVQAFLALSHDERGKRLEALERAVEVESTIIEEAGLPSPVNPSEELYGEYLLELGRAEDAKKQFTESLAHYPRRTASLRGLLKATEALGLEEEAGRVREALRINLERVDIAPDSGGAGIESVTDEAGFTAEARKTIADGIRNRESRDPSATIELTVEIKAGKALVYEARKLGREEHHLMMTDEPFTRGGTDKAASPLGVFMTGMGGCLLNQFNRLSITEDLDLNFSHSTIATEITGEEGAGFNYFIQEVFADGQASAQQLADLARRAGEFCRITTAMRKALPISTVFHVNGEQVTRIDYRPEDYR